MSSRNLTSISSSLTLLAVLLANSQAVAEKPTVISIDVQPIANDEAVKYDYDIVYVRSPRTIIDRDQERPAPWAEFAYPTNVTAGSDLMLLHPDGKEELLVAGGEGAVQDPYVSFDGKSVYYTKFHDAAYRASRGGADICRIDLETRKITQLTQQEFTPNRPGERLPYGVFNMHPCPVPGGRVAFVSNRNGYLPPPKSYPQVATQLHIMDDDGSNIETIGHLNLAGALHPVILKDGRIIFSSLENMGLRNYILWGIWSIHPDGTNWAPFVSALHGHSSPSSWHFQSQLSDENVVVELYYNQNQKGFGSLFKMPPKAAQGESAFGPGDIKDDRNPGWKFVGSNGNTFRVPFTPNRMQSITPWIRTNDFPAWPTVWDDPNSPRIGKVTHPCGAPDNHLLLAWTLGPIGGSAGAVRANMVPEVIDTGIYLLKNGDVTQSPGELLLIKNDPNYNESWPRPVVPYQRIYGVAEPKRLEHQNDGSKTAELPAGTPFGLVGASSMYKRESAPLGAVPQGSVTSVYPGESNRVEEEFTGEPWNWRGQGADAGKYDNSEIHAIRIVSMVPNAHTTAKGAQSGGYAPFSNHVMERLRILGEIPVRKFVAGKQPVDPDGNPDTSFLAKIPADVAFTFQTLDKNGMVLNMAQTWHQLRPGEVRHDCGGCHAHSQQPTLFEDTFAARPDYSIFDLTASTPLIVAKTADETKTQWDVHQETGLRLASGSQDVEYHRDIQPIFQRSCVACHTKSASNPPGGLILDDDDQQTGNLPGTYFRLAADERAQFSPRRLEIRGKGPNVVRGLHARDGSSHYIWKLQSRRSLLVWKLFGRRLDGWDNEAIASEEIPLDDPRRQDLHNPSNTELTAGQRLFIGDIDYTGSIMPPPAAVTGAAQGPDGKPVKVEPLSDEDRRMIARWIDLGCPIDLNPEFEGSGGLRDDQRPTLTVTDPAAAAAEPITRLLVGMFDSDTGLDLNSFSVVADFPVDGAAAGENLASKFQPLAGSRWEYKLSKPVARPARGTLTVTIRDNEGNQSQVVRALHGSAVATGGE